MKYILVLFFVVACASKTTTPGNTKEAATAKAEAKAAATTAVAQSGEEKDLQTLKCIHAKDERVLKNASTAKGGCELKYTKFGETKVVATAVRGTVHCEKVMERVVDSLKTAGFNCQ